MPKIRKRVGEIKVAPDTDKGYMIKKRLLLELFIFVASLCYAQSEYKVTAPWMPLFKDSISSLVINKGCTSIGNFAFYGLSSKNLKTIDIPNSVEQIGQYAFANCEYLKNLYLGPSLEKISANAFANDERLIYITCYAIEPPLLDETAFVNYDAYLSVPCESQADYKVSKGWKLFNKENISCIGAEETPITTDDVTVTPQDNQATLVWPADDLNEIFTADGRGIKGKIVDNYLELNLLSTTPLDRK